MNYIDCKTFDVKKFLINTCIPEENIKISLRHEEVMERLILNLELKLISNLTHTEERKETTRLPATIWEELKRDFAPSWFLRRHPVRYLEENTRYTINHYHVCPHVAIPDNKEHVKFLMGDDDHE